MGLLKAGTELMAENELVCFLPENSVPESAPAEGCGYQPFERYFVVMFYYPLILFRNGRH